MDERDVTGLLRRASQGDEGAGERLLAALYDELHRLARRHMDRQDPDHTLQATALVHEAWLRIHVEREQTWGDRDHFLCFASRAMRSVLVDHARRRATDKRSGAGERLPLDVVLESLGEEVPELPAFDDALRRLAARSAELARLVELRFFGGLSMPEVARVLDTSLSTVERDWRLARIWLREALGAGQG